MEAAPRHRLYDDLASWYPLLSPPRDAEAEAALVATQLLSADVPVQTLLDLGSGAGHLACHLGRHFSPTLLDLSPAMLTESRRLNPALRHVEGDMRSARLGERFDAVVVHDAVDYLTTLDDLARTLATAYEHCTPGGIAVFLPEHVLETWAPASAHGGTDAADGRAARFLAWSWDPDPGDTWTATQYALLLRHPDGRVEAVHEEHRLGLFPRAVWLALLAEAGFEPNAVEVDGDDVVTAPDGRCPPRTVMVGRRPRTAR